MVSISRRNSGRFLTCLGRPKGGRLGHLWWLTFSAFGKEMVCNIGGKKQLSQEGCREFGPMTYFRPYTSFCPVAVQERLTGNSKDISLWK